MNVAWPVIRGVDQKFSQGRRTIGARVGRSPHTVGFAADVDSTRERSILGNVMDLNYIVNARPSKEDQISLLGIEIRLNPIEMSSGLEIINLVDRTSRTTGKLTVAATINA